MTEQTKIPLYSERDTAAVAARLAAASVTGDVYYLTGDLGAGKTTFCQYFLQALGYTGAVTSPTYTLSQEYKTPTTWVTHVDCYRLESPEEAIELGLFEASRKGIVLIEWPDRGDGHIPQARRHLTLEFQDDIRTLIVDDKLPKNPVTQPHRMPPRLPMGIRDIEAIPGDASFRRYYRAKQADQSVILMHAPPPEATEPFVSIARWLSNVGCAAPQILEEDKPSNTLLLEDLGPLTFSRILEGRVTVDKAVDEAMLYDLAHQTLKHLRQQSCPDFLPAYDKETLLDELSLFPQWAGDPAMTADWRQAWSTILDRVPVRETCVVLRDFHVDNMILLPGRQGIQRCGLLDFQDALCGHPAYDLVSLYQDVRRDVSLKLEQEALRDYDDNFLTAYYTLGLQRHFKVIGIFHRLARRDGKKAYLQHIERCWRLAKRCFAAEPSLQVLLQEFSLLEDDGLRLSA